VEVILNEVEERLVAFLAKKRILANRKNDIPDEQVGNQDKLEMEINGLGGELAFCKATNSYPDLTLAGEPGTRPKADTHLFGSLWDVKTTKRADGRLLVRPTKRGQKACEYYVLVTGSMPNYKIVGWIHAEDLFWNHNLKDLGHGKTYVIEQDQLRKVGWLKENK
jgi:hypothetical protein